MISIKLSQVMGIIELAMDEHGDANLYAISEEDWNKFTKDYLASQIPVTHVNTNCPNIYGPLGAVFSKN